MFAFVKQHPAATFLTAALGLGWFHHLPVGTTADELRPARPGGDRRELRPGDPRLDHPPHRGSVDERRSLRRRITTVRVGWRWYAFAIVLPVVHVAAVGLASLAGGTIPFHPAMFAILPLFLLTNFGEEIGWRGYALPKLQERMNPLAASLVLGLVWAAFHWVALLGNGDNTLVPSPSARFSSRP